MSETVTLNDYSKVKNKRLGTIFIIRKDNNNLLVENDTKFFAEGQFWKLRRILKSTSPEIIGLGTQSKVREKCELCGSKKELTRHHLIPKCHFEEYDEELVTETLSTNDNISTLCIHCHRAIHKMFETKELNETFNNTDKLKETRRVKDFLRKRS